MKGVVLRYKGDEVWTELAEGYSLYVCERELFKELTPSQIILLVEQVIQEHIRRTIQ